MSSHETASKRPAPVGGTALALRGLRYRVEKTTASGEPPAYTVLSPTAEPLYSFSDPDGAEREAAALNGTSHLTPGQRARLGTGR